MVSQFTYGHKSPPRAFTARDADNYLRRGYEALMKRNYRDAGACCNLVLKYMPKAIGGHFLAGLIGVETGEWSTAKQAFQSVVSLDVKHAAGWAQLARVFMNLGQYSNADKALENAVALKPKDPLVMDVIGTVYSLLGDQEEALGWFDRACEGSGSASYQLSRAKSLNFLGRLDEAEEALGKVIEKHPRAAQAHLLLSRLKKVENHTHLKEMEDLVSAEPNASSNRSFFYYAIGKEYEDLQEWSQAFEAYERGASARRREVQFDEAAEEAMFVALADTFSKEWLESVGDGHDDNSPIFIVGQPRTGTTLVERIITAHSDVETAGELQQFNMAIKRLTGIAGRQGITPEAIAKIADSDLEKLGQLYLETTRSVRPDTPRYVDKLPVNYLYAPLIAAALPNAKIIHIVRDPLDSCVSSYKQLFAEAYYHSYDQEEMARHHVRYRKLMDRWRSVLGNRMLDVVYEEVVGGLEENAKKIIDFIGLEWQDACLDFHVQAGAVTTASAAQVREKAHSRSVGRWRKFENYIGPMKKVLSESGFL